MNNGPSHHTSFTLLNQHTSYLPGRRIGRRLLQLSRIGLWLVAGLLGAAIGTSQAGSGTKVFSSNRGVSGKYVTDGPDGSSGLAGITLNFSAKGRDTTSLPMNYKPIIFFQADPPNHEIPH